MAARTTRTLEGRCILVTRPRDQAEPLVRMVQARGGKALVAPAIRLVRAPAKAIDPAVADAVAGRFVWLVFTSRAGVEAFFDRLEAQGHRPRALKARVAAVGDGTAAALRDAGVKPALVPPDFTTQALGRAMPGGSGPVLLARADIAPEGLEDVLEAKGWTPVRVDAYRTRVAGSLPRAAQRALLRGEVDAVTLTSASTVRGFVKVAGPLLRHPVVQRGRLPKMVCIGPVTARAAREAGLRVHTVARPHTIEGLVAALERSLRRRSGPSTKERVRT